MFRCWHHWSTCFSLGLIVGMLTARQGFSDSTRTFKAPDPVSNSDFGLSVSASGDRALVGAPGSLIDFRRTHPGKAYIFDVATGEVLHDFTGITRSFGSSVALDDNSAIVGSHTDSGTGAAYIFDASTGEQLYKLMPSNGEISDYFGAAVAINDGIALVGAPTTDKTGYVTVFDVATGAELMQLHPSDNPQWSTFGSALAVNGSLAVIGAPYDPHAGYGSGSAYVFDLTSGKELMKLTASDANQQSVFGSTISIDVNRVLIGASGEGAGSPGAAYLFDLDTGEELFKFESDALPTINATHGDLVSYSYDRFGRSVSLLRDTVFVGSPNDDDVTMNSGAMYAYDATTGKLKHKVKSSISEQRGFGWDVVTDGSIVFVSSLSESNPGTIELIPLIPEPASAVLFSIAMAWLSLCRRKLPVITRGEVSAQST